MKKAVIFFLSLLVSGAILTSSASAQVPVLKGERFEIVFQPGTEVVSQFDNGWEQKIVVEHEGQQVRLNVSNDKASILFPTSTLRISSQLQGQTETLNIYSDADRYRVIFSPSEVGWLLPSTEIFFRTRGGRVSQVVGSNDYLKLYRNTRGGRVGLVSSAGSTDALINSSGKLETFSGPDFTEHLYLVRGLAFQQGPVTLRIPLPKEPFLESLPVDRYLTINKELVPLDTPTSAAPVEKSRDPLQAEPATHDSPQLRARFNDPDEDPIHFKRELRVKHEVDPLRARTQKNSEELLRVKDY